MGYYRTCFRAEAFCHITQFLIHLDPQIIRPWQEVRLDKLMLEKEKLTWIKCELAYLAEGYSTVDIRKSLGERDHIPLLAHTKSHTWHL